MFLKIAVLCSLISAIHSHSKHPILIVVSYDAFRYDFISKNVTPHMESLREQGTYADYIQNVFPTKTFPNHHSISTGLYPEVHGVIGNRIYDPVEGKIIKYGYELFHYNDDIEPLWIINEKAAEDRHSGVMMWPGGQFPYQGVNATYFKMWDKEYDLYKRVDTVISWITDPEKPANLIMLYIEEPDSHGHIYGPNSEVVLNVIQELDNVTQYLFEQLEENGLSDKANVVHLSDHGLSSVTPPRLINLTQYLTPDTYQTAGTSPGLHYIPNEGSEESVYNELKKAAKEVGHFTVYKKEELLDRWNFKNNPRTPPIFVLAEENYGFQDILDNINWYAGKHNIRVTSTTEFGVHGYDNLTPNMRPFFMARGPRIKKNHKVVPFNTVDLLSLFCEILGIVPPPNNGSFSNVADILISSRQYSILTSILIVAGAMLLALVLLTFVATIVLLFIKHQQNLTTAAALNKRFPQNFHHSSIEAQHLLEPEDA